MFGIKTKKDRRIEELETKLATMYYKHPQIIEQRCNVVAVAASRELEYEMPVEVAKRLVAGEMVKYLEPHIHYDVEDYKGKKILKGYLKVVV